MIHEQCLHQGFVILIILLHWIPDQNMVLIQSYESCLVVHGLKKKTPAFKNDPPPLPPLSAPHT